MNSFTTGPNMAATVHTIGDLAKRWNLPPWKVRRAFEKKLVSAERVGAYRIVHERDLNKVEVALRKLGYLPLAGITEVETAS
jgi:hypothetical protein